MVGLVELGPPYNLLVYLPNYASYPIKAKRLSGESVPP